MTLRFDDEVNLWIREQIRPYAVSGLPGVESDSHGNVWILDWFDFLNWDGAGWSMVTLPHPDYFFDLGGISDFAIGPDDVFWIGTNDGLVRWDGVTFSEYDFQNSPLPAKQVSGVDVRDDGLVVVAALEFGPTTPFPSGVVLIDGDPSVDENWSVFRYGEVPLPYQLGRVAFDSHGNALISAISEGVAKMVLAVSGDSDGDGDVDLFDFAAFVSCVTGPAPIGGLLPTCVVFDFDTDNDVDFADLKAMQMAYTGSQ